MAKRATGSVRETARGFAAVVTIEGVRKKVFDLPTCHSRPEALARSALLAEQAVKLRRAGLSRSAAGIALLQELAEAQRPAPVLLVIERACGGEIQLAEPAAKRLPAFAEVAKRWTSGELHELYPDHVKSKDHDDDETRLAWICAIKFDDVALGSIPIDEWERSGLAFYEHVMRNLPARVKRQAARRHYAQVVNRVLELAVYPMRLIARNPIPAGALPSVGKPPLYPYLRPSEEAQLQRTTTVPIHERMATGIVCREGMRVSELCELDVCDVSFAGDRATAQLDENKTDDPRSWALSADTARALRLWLEMRGAKPGDPLVADADGSRVDPNKIAGRLRGHLLEAGVTRSALHERGTNTAPLRFHDLRGSFVTVSLANGRSETWVADRTGHRSSVMINRYRRRAREASELGLGDWLPLDELVPELRAIGTRLEPSGDNELDLEERLTEENVSDSAAVAPPGVEPGHPSGSRILNSLRTGRSADERDSGDVNALICSESRRFSSNAVPMADPALDRWDLAAAYLAALARRAA